MTEQLKKNPYNLIPISPALTEFIKVTKDEQLESLDLITPGLLLMIRLGFATQLRENIIETLSQALHGNIPDSSSLPQQPEK